VKSAPSRVMVIERIFWPLLAIAWTVVILVLALQPQNTPNWVFRTFSDKLLHAAAFACGGIVWVKTGEILGGFSRGRAMIAGSIVSLGVGLAIELLQRRVPGRQADVLDFLADVVGLAAALLCLWLLASWRARVKSASV
jgi:VanZ family protein